MSTPKVPLRVVEVNLGAQVVERRIPLEPAVVKQAAN